MHRQYAKDGFVAISVSIDNPADNETRADVDKFLTKQQATFTNVILDSNPKEYEDKVSSIPCVYVFNQENHFVKKLIGETVDYKVIEAEVVKLLKK